MRFPPNPNDPYRVIHAVLGPEKAIRGKVQWARLMIWKDGTLFFSRDYDENLVPYHVNNMTAWLRGVFKQYRSPLWLKLQQRKLMNHFEFVVNGGQGIKDGRGSNENLFSYELQIPEDMMLPSDHVMGQYDVFSQLRIELHIHSLTHSTHYNRQLKAAGRQTYYERYNQRIRQEGDIYSGGYFTTPNGEKVPTIEFVNAEKEGRLDAEGNVIRR